MNTRSGRHIGFSLLWSFLAMVANLMLAGSVNASDWPTYGHDIARSQITQEKLQLPLQECWVFQARYVPQPAWGDSKAGPVEGRVELRRVHFDDVFQPTAANGKVYFASSADGKVQCLDLVTGKVCWSFLTGGPVRLAPTIADGKAYFGSDDGYVYCLNASDGTQVWKFHAAPDDRRVLGSGKMVSLWPVRTGVLVDGKVAYFGAGIFPAEGVFLYAGDANTGRELWRNDSGGEAPQSTVSPQGYLLASAKNLFVPMGRISPANYDRQTGKLLATPFFGHTVGGTFALLADNRVFTGTEEIISYEGGEAKKKDRFVLFEGHKVVVRGDIAYLTTEKQMVAADLKRYPPLSSKLKSLMTSRQAMQEVNYTPNKLSAEVKEKITHLQEDLKANETKLKTLPAAEQTAMENLIGKIREEIAAKEKELDRLAETIRKNKTKTETLQNDILIARGNLKAGERWQVASRCDQVLILADNILFAGGQGEVIGVEADSGKVVWRTEVEGSAKGLAVSNGRLLVSTDKGKIYAFGPENTPRLGLVTESPVESPQTASLKEAEDILRQSGQRRGYCLMLGGEKANLALDLARHSELMIYVVSPDAGKVAAARKLIDAAGLYGARIVVEQWPLEKVPYASYFANLIVSDSTLSPQAVTEAWRMLKPQGGVAILAQPDLPPSVKAETPSVSKVGLGTKIVRGPLPGGGNWTHQYANPANTTCGDDQLVKFPLSVLWFGYPGPGEMINRHERGTGPVVLDGRVFCQGENIIIAFDAYNGMKLWERPMPGARRTNASDNASNLVVCREGLLVVVDDKCYRLDLETGKTLATYSLPPGPGEARWGYLASDGTRIYGSRSEVLKKGTFALLRSQNYFSTLVFALDLKSGQTLWTHSGKRIPHTTISLGDGRLYLVDDGATPQERQEALASRIRQIAELPEDKRAAAEKALAKADVRLVCALDAATGKVSWQIPMDMGFAAGGVLATTCPDNTLVLFGVYSDGHYWKQFFAGTFSKRGVAVLAGATGKLLWTKELGYRVRPVVIGDTLHAEPWAFDLRTGQQRTRVNPITGNTEPWQFARPGHHCGCPAASPNGLFFRSLCLGYYDLAGDFGTQHFSGQRPGCWINFIPAAGLLIMPEASTGCNCAFNNLTTVVFAPTQKMTGYAYYSATGPTLPVRRLALNFGATGDRKDSAGNLWLGYPRPSGSLVLPLKIKTIMGAGGAYVKRNSAFTPIAGTDDPWLFTSAVVGSIRCTIPLVDPADGKAQYRVRLAFADPDNDKPGQRVFGIKLQGKTVCPQCDIARESGGKDRALIKEFAEIEIQDNLLLELVPRAIKLQPEQMPILQGVEIIRERVVSLGCTTPPIVLTQRRLKHKAEIQLGNLRDQPFEGFLEFESQQHLKVTPSRLPVNLVNSKHSQVQVDIVAGSDLKEGLHAIAVKFVRADGTVDSSSAIPVEYLGRRDRLVIPVTEDAYADHRYPDMNKGKAEILNIDGGDKEMGDLDHSQAFLKFRFQVPGKVVRTVLRLHNAGNPTGDSGNVRLVSEPWSEESICYANRPKLGPVLGKLGPVNEFETVECPLAVDLSGKTELSIAIDPTSLDGVDYYAREGLQGPELTIEYEVP